MPELIVKIVGDTSNLDRSFRRASQSASRFDRSIKDSSRGVVAATASFTGLRRAMLSTSASFIGGVGVVAVLKSSVDAASNLAEQITKTNVVFGDSAEEVKAWSRTTVTAMGLAEDQALATASSFGALLAPLGITGQAAAQQAEALTKLGADLASFYNTSVQDALDAIRSGLVGEAEPLRRYGVLLSEARVQAEALTETHKTSVRELTAQEKVLARQTLIFRDSAQAQGDFARTSDGLANQQRILAANIRQLQITLGTALIPAVTETVKQFNKWLGSTENQERLARDLTGTIGALTDAFLLLASAIDKATAAYKSFRDAGDDLPGGKGGFLDTLITGTLPEQIDDFRDRTEKLGRAFGLIRDNASQATPKLSELGSVVSSLADAVTRVDAAFRNAAPAASVFADAASRAAAAAANPRNFTGPLLGLPGGTVQLPSRAVTPAERLAIQIAGDPENERLIREARAKQNARLAFATKMLDERRGNTAKFVAAAQDAAARISSFDSQLAGIAAARVAAAEAAARDAQAARDRIREAEEKRRQAVIDAIGEGARGAVEVANAFEKARAQLPALQARLSGTGRLTAEQLAARQFKALGLGPAGEELAPTLRGLRAQANRIGKALEGTFLDKPKTRSVMQNIRNIISGQLGGVRSDVRKTVKGILDDLDRQLKDHSQKGGPETLFRTQSVRKALLAAGIDPDAVKRASFALSQRGPGGTFPGVGRGAFGVPLTSQRDIVVKTQVDLDGRQVALNTTRHQQVRRRRNPPQKRGPHAGGPQ